MAGSLISYRPVTVLIMINNIGIRLQESRRAFVHGRVSRFTA